MGNKSRLAWILLLLILLTVAEVSFSQQLYVQLPISTGGGMDFDSLKAQLQKRGVNYGSNTLFAVSGNYYNIRMPVDSMLEYTMKVEIFDYPDTFRVSDKMWPDIMLFSNYEMSRRAAIYAGVPCDSSKQILFPLGTAPKDSVQVWCSDGATWSYVRTIMFRDPVAGVVDTILILK